MNFAETRARLLQFLRDRVRNGDITERAFARKLGISQPHVHNVLKGSRNLSDEVADFILEALDYSLLHLFSDEEIARHLAVRTRLAFSGEVAVLSSPLGPGREWPQAWRRRRVRAPFAASSSSPELAIAVLLPDPAMPVSLRGVSCALLDTSAAATGAPGADCLYALRLPAGALIRWVRPGRGCVYVCDDVRLNRPVTWDKIDLLRTPDAVKGKVLWLGAQDDVTEQQPEPGV